MAKDAELDRLKRRRKTLHFSASKVRIRQCEKPGIVVLLHEIRRTMLTRQSSVHMLIKTPHGKTINEFARAMDQILIR